MTDKPAPTEIETDDAPEEDLATQLGLVSTKNFKSKLMYLDVAAFPGNDTKAMASPEPSDGLVESIRLNGQHDPINVIDRGEKGYDIRDGRRRVKVARILKEAKIMALVWPEELGNLEGLLITTTTNSLRSDNALSDIEVIRQLEKKYKVTDPKQIAGLTRMPFSTVTSRLRLKELFDSAPEIETYVKKNRISVTVAEAMVPLTPAQRQGLLDKLAKDKAAKLTLRDVHDAKRVQVAQAAAGLGLPDMSLPATPAIEKYILLDEANDEHEPLVLDVSLDAARQELADNEPGYILYKLVRV